MLSCLEYSNTSDTQKVSSLEKPKFNVTYLKCLLSLVLSCLTSCNPMDWSPPGSSVHGILQARVLEWVAISFSRGASQLRDETHVSCVYCIGRWIFYHCVI